MASSKINVFDFDQDEAFANNPIAAVHSTRRNAPCNCRECLPFFFIHGAGVMKMATHPATGEEVFIPALTDDDTRIFALSANFYRKFFAKDCNSNMEIFASFVIDKKWRAYSRPVVSSTICFTDVKKRKSSDDGDIPRKAANTEASAASLMPASAVAAASAAAVARSVALNVDGDDEEENDDEEEE